MKDLLVVRTNLLKESCKQVDDLSVKYKEEQKIRKRLNNELEDMKGKIRVYCRIRPLSKTEREDPERAIRCYKIVDEMTVLIDPESKLA